MCRAADKLLLINGFSPGHLISLALSLKSNLTLCMSVNISKPSNPALKCHLLCRTWCQAREPIWWRGRFLCVFEIGSERNLALFSDIHQHRAGIEQLWFQSPIMYHRCPFMLHSGIVLHSYILQSTNIIPFSLDLEYFQPGLGNVHADVLVH